MGIKGQEQMQVGNGISNRHIIEHSEILYNELVIYWCVSYFHII